MLQKVQTLDSINALPIFNSVSFLLLEKCSLVLVGFRLFWLVRLFWFVGAHIDNSASTSDIGLHSSCRHLLQVSGMYVSI